MQLSCNWATFNKYEYVWINNWINKINIVLIKEKRNEKCHSQEQQETYDKIQIYKNCVYLHNTASKPDSQFENMKKCT